MYLKVCPGYKGKIYLSLVQGYRDENGKVKQKTIEKLGYLEDLKNTYDDPISYFKEIAKQRSNDEINELVIKNLKAKTIDENSSSKNLGYVILKNIFHELELDTYLNEKQKKFKFDYNLNSIFQLLVYSRILYPSSKNETYNNKNIFFENFDFSLKDLYRSLDYFYDFKDEILKLVWDNTKKSYNRDTTISYYDTTNYYF